MEFQDAAEAVLGVEALADRDREVEISETFFRASTSNGSTGSSKNKMFSGSTCRPMRMMASAVSSALMSSIRSTSGPTVSRTARTRATARRSAAQSRDRADTCLMCPCSSSSADAGG